MKAFCYELINQRENRRYLRNPDGLLHITLTVQLYNPREMNITITSLIYSFSGFDKETKEKPSYILVPEPDVYEIQSNREIKSLFVPFTISPKETRYIIVSFSINQNILEMLSIYHFLQNEEIEEAEIVKNIELFASKLGVNIYYEDKRIDVWQPFGKPECEFYIFEEGFPFYREMILPYYKEK